MKQAAKFKQIISSVLSAVVVFCAIPFVPAHADSSTRCVAYISGASSRTDIVCNTLTVNGDFVTDHDANIFSE